VHGECEFAVLSLDMLWCSAVLVKNRVGVACHELVRIYCDEGRAADGHINSIREDEYTKRWHHRKGVRSRLRLRASGGGWWACIREDYDARVNTLHAAYVVDTYLNRILWATVRANALGRRSILGIVIMMTHSNRGTRGGRWLGNGWKSLQSGTRGRLVVESLGGN